jgi:hypothetical protein
MFRPYNIFIPRSVFTKMVNLQEDKPKIFYYLFQAVKSFFDKNLSCEETINNIRQIRFTLTKKKKHSTHNIQLHFINTKPQHVMSDEDGFLKKRMENYYKFESDVEFVLTLLYFFCKHYGIDYGLMSDKIFEKKVFIQNTELPVHGNDEAEMLKYIYIDLKPS